MLFLNPTSLLFSFTLILGVIIASSSPTWFTSWIGLELNVMSFIPFILSKSNTFSSEAALKYFLIQALSSITLMAGATSMLILTSAPMTLIMLSLLLKMGAAPMHFWLIPVMQGLPWIQCIVLLTVQKIAPMALTTYVVSSQTSSILMMASIMSALAGGVGGLNQTMLRKIMAYSSINHMAWMLAAIYLESSLWANYLFIYSIISASIATMLASNQTFHIKDLFSISTNQINKVSMFITIFSLGGLPPLLGFIPKLMVALTMTSQQMILWLFILAMTTLITLFYYMRISMMALTMASPKIKMNTNKSINHKSAAVMIINSAPMLLPLTALLQF